jgi:hypothetical protein
VNAQHAPSYIAIEGAVDRFCGRPLGQNPYAPGCDAWEWWRFGWLDADQLLEERGAEEAARWLNEAA